MFTAARTRTNLTPPNLSDVEAVRPYHRHGVRPKLRVVCLRFAAFESTGGILHWRHVEGGTPVGKSVHSVGK